MCNAKSLRKPREYVRGLFDQAEIRLANDLPAFEPRYRIGPRQKHLVVFPDQEDGYSVTMAQWDLVPPGNSKPFLRTNARADALTSKWPWKMLLRHNRCITPVDGFYEPEKPARSKETVPWSYYERKDSDVFWMPGLFARRDKSDDDITYTIVTTEANESLRVHDRMPVMLDLDEAMQWLQDEDPPLHLLRPYPAEHMHGWRVADEAKSSRGRDHPGLIQPVEDQLSGSIH